MDEEISRIVIFSQHESSCDLITGRDENDDMAKELTPVVLGAVFFAWLCRFQVIHARAGHSVVVNRFTGEFQVIRSEVRRVMPLE